jgi:hypothetical protein
MDKLDDYEYYEVYCFCCDGLLGGSSERPKNPPFCSRCLQNNDACVSCKDNQKCWDKKDDENSPCVREVLKP